MAKDTQQGTLCPLISTWKFLSPRLMLRLLGHSLKKNLTLKRLTHSVTMSIGNNYCTVLFFKKNFLLHKQYMFIIKKLEITDNQMEEIADTYILF